MHGKHARPCRLRVHRGTEGRDSYAYVTPSGVAIEREDGVFIFIDLGGWDKLTADLAKVRPW